MSAPTCSAWRQIFNEVNDLDGTNWRYVKRRARLNLPSRWRNVHIPRLSERAIDTDTRIVFSRLAWESLVHPRSFARPLRVRPFFESLVHARTIFDSGRRRSPHGPAGPGFVRTTATGPTLPCSSTARMAR